MASSFNFSQPWNASVEASRQKWKVQDVKLRDLTSGITFCNDKQPVCQGGASDVYQGQYDGKIVALKQPRFRTLSLKDIESTTRRFWREVEHWNTFEHPNILKMIGVVGDGESIYIASWWAGNGDIVQYIKRSTGLTRHPMICGFMSGLAFLHDNNIVHGDIKGANILVSDSGQPMIMDFGLSKASASATSTDMIGKGTLQWQAPELFNGQTKSKASDVYAAALVIYEVLALETPYGWIRGNDSVIMRSVLNGKRPPCSPEQSELGELYQSYWEHARNAWAGNPSDRPTIRSILSGLENISPRYVASTPPPVQSVSSEPEVTSSPDTHAEAEQTEVYSGHMEMQDGRLSYWFIPSQLSVRYHFRLEGSRLSDYSSHDNGHPEPVGSIELSSCKLLNIIHDTSTGYKFSVINTDGQPVHFIVETLPKATKWVQLITKSMIRLERKPDGVFKGNFLSKINPEAHGFGAFLLRLLNLDS